MSIVYNVGFYEPTPSGATVLRHRVPSGDSGLVVVMGNRGYGYQPIKVCMPHQVYRHTIEEIFAETDLDEVSVATMNKPVLVARKPHRIRRVKQ